MKQIYVRPARASESKQFLDWSRSTKGNAFDPEVASRPSTFTLVAYDNESPIVYMPVSQPLVLESLGAKPDADNVEIAMSIRELFKAAVMQGHLKASGEIYFVGSNPLTNSFAEKHGFEKIEYPVYRLRLSDLEKQ